MRIAMGTLTLALAVACGGGSEGSDQGNESGASGGDGDGDAPGGDGDGDESRPNDPDSMPGTSEPSEPRDDGCIAPPAADYDPTEGYEWDAPTPDIVVTSSAAAGDGSLADALAQVEAGEVIGFDGSLAGATIPLEEALSVTRSITIDASGAPGLTLDGQDQTQIMVFEKALNSTVVGLTFANGHTTEEGGAIKVRQADRGDVDNPNPKGSIEIIGCRFDDNEGVAAGALFIGWRIDAIIRDSVFSGNTAAEGTQEQNGKSGGAIATRQNASLLIQRSSFVENTGPKSGAVYNILEPVEVEDSVFINNVATSGSGAFFTDGGNGAGPSNDPESGADGTMILRRVRVEGNTGTGDGGALLLWGYPRDVLIIESSVIKDNTTSGDKGGGGRLHGLSDVFIVNTTFAGNHSEQQGGGFWLDGTGDVTIENSTFSGNSVTRDAGAGFTYNGDGTLTIESSMFAYNDAGRAAGGFWKKPSVTGTVSNSIFAFNTVGDNIGERHIGPRPEDGGGNIDFALTDEDRGRAFEGSTFVDPQIGELTELNGTWLHPLSEGSPAVGAATSTAPELDARGASRDDAPDVGPHEVGAECTR